jgi:hypothetical protein
VTGLGDCFEANGRAFQDNKSPTARLIHADITPKIGAVAGRTYGHAWIEDGNKLVDHTTVGTDVMDLIGGFDDEEFAKKGISSKSIFYQLTDPKNIKSYDNKQMATMITKHKHWGPWPEQNMESKIELDFLDNEITEGRLLRTTNNFKKLTGRDVADLLYLNSLVIYIMAKDSKQSKFALGYARKTTQYGNYTLFRTHATDLYLLSYIINNPDSKQIKLKDTIFSKRFLNSCKFEPKQHSQFFYKLASQGKVPLATTYFMSLERQIKINDSRYKSWRRLAVDWEHLKYRSRQYIVAKIIQEFRRIAITSELVSNLQTMTKYRSYDITDKYSRKPSTGRKVAGAVAGAVAGGYAGKKIAKKLGKDSDKYKKAGAGIGAIAGYWAGGRQKQK